MKPYINVNERVFLIRYNFQMGKQVICTQDNMEQTLKENNNLGGIDFIKEYTPSKQAFKPVSKKLLNMYFSWDTGAMDELKKNHLI